MNRYISRLLLALLLSLQLAACSTPEEKAQKYYNKGMELLESNPDKAKLEFQNALQIKKNMTQAMYGLALVAERKGDIKATFGLLNKVIDQDPKHIEALIKSGQIVLAGDRIDFAVDRINKAKAIDPNNVGVLNLDAALQLKQGNNAQAVELANKTLAKDPKNQDAMVVLATERLTAKAPEQALGFLDKALASNPQNTAVQVFRINVLEMMGKLPEADRAFNEMIKTAKDQVMARTMYARYLSKHQRNTEVEAQLKEIAKIKPKDLAPKLDLVRFLVATKDASAGRAQLEAFAKASPKDDELAFALVEFYRQQGDTASVEKALQAIVANSETPASTYKAKTMMAYNLLKAGNKAASNKLLAEVLDEDKNNEQALLLRAGQALEAKNYDAAIIDLRTALREAPDNPNTSWMLANAHEQSGSPELAEEHYLKAFQASKSAPRYGMQYVQFLMRRNQPERAEKILEQVLEANPKDVDTLRALAQFKLQRGDKVGAQALADKAKEADKNSPVADEIEGVISLADNDLAGSIESFKRAHKAAPNASQPIIALVRAYMQTGKKAEALSFLDSVLKANPNHLDAIMLKGQLYATSGEPAKAAEVFNGLIASQPNNALGYQQLAMLQQQNKQLPEAESTVKRGLSLLPNDFGLKIILAGVYESSDRAGEAVKLYEEALKIRPDSQVVMNNLASLLSERDDKASLERALTLAQGLKDSGIPQFLDTYGWASYKTGKLDEAEAALKEVVEKMPNGAVYHYHLGKVYAAKNDKVLAKQSLQKAIKVAGDKPFNGKDDALKLLKSL